MKMTDRITVKMPLYGVILLGTVAALLAIFALLPDKGAEIGSADYRRYEAVAADNDDLKGPLRAALADDGIITTDEARILDAQVRDMALGSYQVTGDARGELEHELDKTVVAPGQ